MNNYDVGNIYKEMELHLIQSMKRNLSRHLKEEQEEGFNWPQWQTLKLKEIKRFQRENVEIIGFSSNLIDNTVKQQLKSQFREGSKSAQKEFKKALKNGYKYDGKLNNSFFGINDRKVNSLIKDVNNDLDTANHAALRMLNDEYRQVIHKSAMFAANGVMTEKQAIDMATKDFLNRGINCIEYRNGRRVNIASYSQMAVRTAHQRAYMQGEGEFRKKIGNSLIKITEHGTACSLCQVWENKILIDDVYSGGTKEDGKYPLLSFAMKKGLYHPNCEHGLSTYYPELENIEFDENGPTEITMKQYQDDLNYCNLQIQRFKRLELGSLDESNIKYYSEQRKVWNNRKQQSARDKRKIKNLMEEARTILPSSFQERTKGVKINIHNKKYSYFDIKENSIYLSQKSSVYTFIHELGHKFQETFTKEEKALYNKLIKNKFSKYTKKDFAKIKSKTGKYWKLEDSSSFISSYQTRIYDGIGNFIFGKVNTNYAKEYFSEGLKCFYQNPKLLKEKDYELYKFIEKVIK